MSIMTGMKVVDYRSLRYQDEKSAKFWSIALSGCSHTVNYGRFGTDGQTQTKDFPTEDAARKSYDKLVAEKVKKGYVEDANVPSFIMMKACEKVVTEKFKKGVDDGTLELPSRDLTDNSPESLLAHSSAMSELYFRLLSEEMKQELDRRDSTLVAAIPTPVTTSTAKVISSPSVQQAKSDIKHAHSIEIPLAIEPKPIELNIERSIDLDPEDWYWATWRNLPPLQRPEPKPFDLQDCLARLRKVTNSWNWSKAKIATSLSPEEAHFWFAAIAKPKKKQNILLTPDELAESLARQTFDGKVPSEQIEKFYHHLGRWRDNQFAEIIPLMNLLKIEDLIELSYDKPAKNAVITKFRDDIFPYLTKLQIENWRSHFRSRLNPNRWPTQATYSEPPAEFFLAAYLGMYDESLALVESWSDDNFSHPDRFYVAHYHRPQEIIFGLQSPELVERHIRRLGLKLQPPQYVWKASTYIRAWLAHTEYSALDVIRDTVLAVGAKEEAKNLLEIFALVKAPEAAPFMLELMLSSKAPQIARQWLEENPAHAIAGVIPIAAGRGKLADAAIEFLQSMKCKGYTTYIQTCIDKESSEIAEKIRSNVLNVEEQEWIEFDESTTPGWLQQAIDTLTIANKKITWQIGSIDLPPIVCGDYCLNDRQIAAALNALRQSELGNPHALVAAIKTHANSAELDTFVWKLFERWLGESAPSKENWAMVAIGLLGSNISALKLAPLVKIWPGESQHARAVLGLSCLRSIGSDTALMQINSIAQKVKFKGIKQRAQECMEAIATERNMSHEQLEDRIVPDCDLDENGSRMFDFGGRQFQFILSENLKPMVKDAEGKIKTDLPKPNAKDDREKAEQAIVEWKLLKKQISEILKLQPARLERAMVTGRRWQLDEFVTLLVQHPLMTHLVRRIVWGGYDGAGKLISTFRVTEDRTYADERDETCQLAALDRIGIIHPLYLSAEQLANWGEILSDYEIMPPFQQIGRSIYKLESGEEMQTEITRFKDAKVPAIALVGTLDKSGWVRGTPQDAGIFAEHFKPFPAANVTAVVEYEGVPIGYMDGWDDQSIERCYFLLGISTNIYANRDKAIVLGNIDPLVISEVFRDLTSIAAKAK
jgi:predicted DNA-binding WGR domain protein